ncbi:MAG: hypothetical protein CVU52_01325 [Deltaproteobacteria bacterium HGW-Deltaproteobacteria-10]|nr:MAG: hypothetical protein CVU52_01325 [Deltaproteobacteria bacterium HGW-Deltaproteobacteria-10]
MKIKFVLITFIATALIASSTIPVHAGKAIMGNLHKQNAYAMRVTFSLLGENTVSGCAPGGGNYANNIEDTVRAVSKIVVYKTDSCINTTPGNQIGPVLKEYYVPQKLLNINNSFGVQIEENGSIDIKEYQY